MKKFQRDGCLCITKHPERPGPSDERLQRVGKKAFQRSPRKNNNSASQELGIPQPTLWRIICKRLRVKLYGLELLQSLTHDDKARHLQFCTEMQQNLVKDGCVLKIFSDKATFYVHGKVSRHNVHTWGTENPHAATQHIRGSPKLNVFRAVSSTCTVHFSLPSQQSLRRPILIRCGKR